MEHKEHNMNKLHIKPLETSNAKNRYVGRHFEFITVIRNQNKAVVISDMTT